MNLNRIILNWIITVLTGSLLTSIVLAVTILNIDELAMFLLTFLISCVMSCCASLPILLILALQLTHLKKIDTDIKEMRKTLFFTHLIGGICTFALLYFILEFPNKEVMGPILFFIYAGIGLLLWEIDFRRTKSEENITKDQTF